MPNDIAPIDFLPLFGYTNKVNVNFIDVQIILRRT